jgi:hypothetical protein
LPLTIPRYHRYKEPKKIPAGFNSKRGEERELLDVVSGLFDAHAHLVDFKQVSSSKRKS